MYGTNGNLITLHFISNAGLATGVAWDGTNFWTSDVFSGSVSEWSSAGAFIQTETLSGYPNGFPPLIEGMSFNFAQTVGTPERGTLVMFGSGMIGLAGLLRRKFKV